MRTIPKVLLVFGVHAGATLLAVLLSFRSAVGELAGGDPALPDRLADGAARVLGFPVLSAAEHLGVNLFDGWALYSAVALNSLLWTELLWALYDRYATRRRGARPSHLSRRRPSLDA